MMMGEVECTETCYFNCSIYVAWSIEYRKHSFEQTIGTIIECTQCHQNKFIFELNWQSKLVMVTAYAWYLSQYMGSWYLIHWWGRIKYAIAHRNRFSTFQVVRWRWIWFWSKQPYRTATVYSQQMNGFYIEKKKTKRTFSNYNRHTRYYLAI